MASKLPAFEVNVAEYRKLKKRLAKLPGNIDNNVTGQALNYAMTPVVSAARKLAKAPGRSGLLSKSMGKKSVRYKARGVAMCIVGPRKGFKDPATGENPVNIAHLIEFGVAPHVITAPVMDIGGNIVKGGVEHPGFAAMPFMRPALDANRGQALARYRSKVKQGLDREVMKLRKSS